MPSHANAIPGIPRPSTKTPAPVPGARQPLGVGQQSKTACLAGQARLTGGRDHSSQFSFVAGATSTLTEGTSTPPNVRESLVNDTGASNSDKITSDDALTGGGDANAVVTFTEGVSTIGTATANGSGT